MRLGHASVETLVAWAFGTLPAGAHLVVGVHLTTCSHCRREVARFEAMGGVLLAAAEPEALRPQAFDEALAKLDSPPPAEPWRVALDALMRRGVWIPLGRGLAMKSLNRFADDGERLCIIRAEPGVAMPDHGHMGAERMVVIAGAVDDNAGHYVAGDLAEAGPGRRHRPIATGAETSLCLLATGAPLKLSGFARLIRPILGF
jgi:putative transcriptional regulator